MNESLQIQIQIEGLDVDKNHMRFDSLLSELDLILKSLTKIDVLVDDDGRKAVYYTVIQAEMPGTSLVLILEPVKLVTQGRVPSDARVLEFHQRYFQELKALHDGKPPSEDVDDDTLKVLDKLAQGRGKDYKSIRIQNHQASVPIDQKFADNVTTYLREQPPSVGSMAGRLDAINVHEDTNAFWIYPSVGPRRVRCNFTAGNKEKALAHVGKCVCVEGKKFYRPKSPFPHRIDVTEFYEVESADEDHMINLYGLLSEAGKQQESSVEFVRNLRDEWE